MEKKLTNILLQITYDDVSNRPTDVILFL